ncbi:MAG: MurR/RpiR family transcriptional regulator [Lactobacillus sp.]
MNVIDKVINSYDSFKNKSKEIANNLLQNPETFLTKNAQELGEINNTSAASIVRFCQQLGFTGLKEFQIELARNLPSKQEKVINTLVDKEDTSDVVMLKLQASVEQSFDELIKIIDKDKLNEAVNLLRKAGQVYLEGIGASSLPAEDLFFKLIRSGRIVYYNNDPHIALERSFFSTSKDVMIVFSYSGMTTEILLIAKQAKKNKTPLIVVTRNKKSPLASMADIVLPLPAKEKLLRVGAVNSLFSELFVENVLYLSMITNDLEKLTGKLQHTAELTNNLKVFEKED